MYIINNISFEEFGIIPGKVPGEGIALKGCFDLPKRIGDTHYSWADEDSVEPFVGNDEISLGNRNLEFYGLMLGKKNVVKNNLKLFRDLIATFNDLVLLETPYGSFSVIVKNIKPKIKEGRTTIKINFIEPKVGIDVAPPIDETIYYSAEYSENAIKNNCDSGYSGTEVTLTSPTGAFTSILSQIAANQLAIDWVRQNKQQFANVNGSCTINPTIYYNTTQSAILIKNDCGNGYSGTVVTYVVEAFTYSSLISQIDANVQAQAEISANFTQQYANDNGHCTLQNLFYETANNVSTITTTYGQASVRYQKFYVSETFPVGTEFFVSIYGVVLSYISVANDTREDVINGLAVEINNTTELEWDANFQAPVFGGNTHKPEAGMTSPPIPNLFPQFHTPQLYTYINQYGQATVWFEIP